MADWSLLPEDLLNIISMHLVNFFEVIHAQSVCSSWRSALPFPSCLLRQSYILPAFDFKDLPDENKNLCTLKKIPLILFRDRDPASAYAYASASAPVYYLGGVDQDESKDHVEFPSHIQCSVKLKIQGSDPTFRNMVDIVPLGHKYRIIGGTPGQRREEKNISVAFLPLNKESGGGEFVVLIGYLHELLVLRSAEMKWVQLNRISYGRCRNIVTFRGRFYATFLNGDVFVIDPYSLKGTRLMPSPALRSLKYLVTSGDDELFLVEMISLPFDRSECTLRVRRLDEETCKWVVVRDLGDRVLFILHSGYFSCSAKDLPDDCGVSGNSIVFARHLGNVGHIYKYYTESAEDDHNYWRPSRENRLMVLDRYPVLAFQVMYAKD